MNDLPNYEYDPSKGRYGGTSWEIGHAYQEYSNSPKELLLRFSENGNGIPQWVIEVVSQGKFYVVSKSTLEEGWELMNLQPSADKKPSIILPTR